MTTLSVIIPTYNRRDYLIECLASVAAQRHRPHEVIVVDDGSTDGTAEAVMGLEGVKLIRQSNAGPGAARNRGAAAAKGRYLAFLDSDDLWFPWTVQAYLGIARRVSPSFIVGTNIHFSNRLDAHISDTEPSLQLFSSFFEGYRQHQMGVPTPSTCIQTDVFQTVGGFADVSVGEDVDLWLRLGCFPGFAWLRSPPLSAQRLHPGSITRNYRLSLSGAKTLIKYEDQGRFPGGEEWADVRFHRLSAMVRSESIAAAKHSLRDAIFLYVAGLRFNAKAKRFRYIAFFPLLAVVQRLRALWR